LIFEEEVEFVIDLSFDLRVGGESGVKFGEEALLSVDLDVSDVRSHIIDSPLDLAVLVEWDQSELEIGVISGNSDILSSESLVFTSAL